MRTNKERRCPRMRAAPFVASDKFPCLSAQLFKQNALGEGRGTPFRVSSDRMAALWGRARCDEGIYGHRQ